VTTSEVKNDETPASDSLLIGNQSADFSSSLGRPGNWQRF
jgi:hypothetical protein